MGRKWTEEENALILQEAQHPTLTNKALAEQLGRSVASIAAKKRYALEQYRPEAEDEATEELPEPDDTEMPDTAEPETDAAEDEPEEDEPETDDSEDEPETAAVPAFREWTSDEDASLFIAPLKSETDLAKLLNRTKEDVHRRRVYFQRLRAAEKERKARELEAQKEAAKRNKRIPLETCTTLLKSAENGQNPEIQENTEAAAAETVCEMPVQKPFDDPQTRLDVLRAAVSLLRYGAAVDAEAAAQDFFTVADFVLGE